MSEQKQTGQSNKSKKDYLDRLYQSWEDNFERLETRIRIIFGASIIAMPTFFTLDVSETGGKGMTGWWSFCFGMSFWAFVITGSLLFRNSSRTEMNRKLKNIEDKVSGIERTNLLLEAIAKHFDIDTISLGRQGAKNGESKPNTQTPDSNLKK